MLKNILTCFVVALAVLTLCESATPYSMYVWRTGWDPDASPICADQSTFLNWSNPSCFTHSWNTPAKRAWLWSTCLRPGREIDEIYLYDVVNALSTRDCNNPQVRLIKETLSEGKVRVQGLRIYALFSDGGDAIPEQNHVPHVVWYNTVCTGANQAAKFDGVAVNNENYNKEWTQGQMVTYLDNLDQIRVQAHKQLPAGSLKTHFSVGWHWGKNSAEESILVLWKGKLQSIMRHFIDIFDGLDVQTAFISSDAMATRVRTAEWDYAVGQGKPPMVNAYINHALPCQTTFFPFRASEPDCPAWSHAFKSETAMFTQLDELEKTVPGVKGCLHYFRGAYSSGGHPDWPKH